MTGLPPAALTSISTSYASTPKTAAEKIRASIREKTCGKTNSSTARRESRDSFERKRDGCGGFAAHFFIRETASESLRWLFKNFPLPSAPHVPAVIPHLFNICFHVSFCLARPCPVASHHESPAPALHGLRA